MRSPFSFISSRVRVVMLGMVHRLELGDFAAPEVAVRQLGMRNRQIRLLHGALAVPHDIEVQGARPPALAPLTPSLRLDRATLPQQLVRSESRFDQHHLIQVGILRYRSDGRGLFHLRYRDDARTRQLAETPARVRELRRPVTDVGPQGDVYAFASGGDHGGLRYVRKATSQVTEHSSDLFEVAGSPFEVGQSLRGLHRARRDVVRFGAVLAGDTRHGVDALAQPVERHILLAGGGGDATGVRRRLCGGGYDRVERLERGGRQLLDVAHVDLPAPHLFHDFADLRVNVLDELARFRRRGGALLGKPADFIGDDAESFAMLPRARRFDRGVECQEIGHVRQLANRRDEAGDAPAHLPELLYLARALTDEGLERDEPLDRLADLFAVPARHVARGSGGASRPHAVIGDAA